MATRPEKKSARSAVVLAGHFLHKAEKLGLTLAQLQRLRESPERMKEFVQLAKRSEEDYERKIARVQYEKECAVDIGGTHYHLVLITHQQLMDWGCESDSLISRAVEVVAYHRYEPLLEEAYPIAAKILQTISLQGRWIGWNTYGFLVHWERTEDGVKSLGSFGAPEGMLLSHFPELCGMVFMTKFIGCDYASTPTPVIDR